MTSEPDSNHVLLAQVQADEPSALNAVVGRWQGPLLRFAYRYAQNLEDAQDLAAETLYRFYRNRRSLRPDTNLSAWLFTTLANLCRNHHRWKRRHPTLALEPARAQNETGDGAEPEQPGLASSEPDPQEHAAEAEKLAILKAAIDALPHDLKTALLLHHYERLSYREISVVVGCSARGVETRLYRARHLLRASLRARLE